MVELAEIQTRLALPKNKSILEAVKPLLKELKCTITFNDDLVMIGERIFCKSTAIIKNSKGEIETASSFAELDNASSNSHRKAICSLLAIDNNDDIDSIDNNIDKAQESKLDNLKTFCSKKKTEAGVNQNELLKFWEYYKERATNWKGNFDVPALFEIWMKGK